MIKWNTPICHRLIWLISTTRYGTVSLLTSVGRLKFSVHLSQMNVDRYLLNGQFLSRHRRAPNDPRIRLTSELLIRFGQLDILSLHFHCKSAHTVTGRLTRAYSRTLQRYLFPRARRADPASRALRLVPFSFFLSLQGWRMLVPRLATCDR